MAGYTGNKPKAANQVLLDLIEMEDNFEFFQSAFAQISGGWSNSAVTALVVGNKGAFTRAKFRWKDADEIYIGGAAYHHAGTTDQMVFWDSEITFQLGSAGSNSLSDDLGASAFHYIYIDDSAVVTLALNELTAAEFLNDTTAPTYSASKHGWYNGSDRCIGAVWSNASSQVAEFYHDADLFLYGDLIQNVSSQNVTDTWINAEAAFTLPDFVRKALVTFRFNYISGTSQLYWRTDGQTGTTGHIVASVDNVTTWAMSSMAIIVSSGLLIELKESANTSNLTDIYTDGWFFPIGM